MYRITKTFEFAAAHHLECVPVGHKCRRPHGHTYYVTVMLDAEELTNNMVLDYGDLSKFKAWLDTNCDHQDLNTAFEFEPTAENLAAFFFGYCERQWGDIVSCVRVQESPTSSAEYSR